MIKPNKCNKTSFLSIFQPMNPFNKRTEDLVNYVRANLSNHEIYDFTYLKDDLNFIDHSHIDQESKKIISEEIYPIITKIFNDKNLC